jgi:hypothetical protein
MKCNLKSYVVFSILDESQKLARASNITTFTNINEICIFSDTERF